MTKLNQFRRTSATTFAALAACLIAGTSFAASPQSTSSVTVRYGDLDLSREQDMSTLHARVTAAARQVCGADGVDMRNLQAYAEVRSCETQAIADAERDVHGAKVAALAARH
ncbi:MAG TPA: UrcA family protein [Steroidobacteraceae bacterium]